MELKEKKHTSEMSFLLIFDNYIDIVNIIRVCILQH